MLRTRVKAGPLAGLILSLVAAVLFTAIQAGDAFVRAWAPRFDHPTATTFRVTYGPRVVHDPGTGRAEIEYRSVRVLVPPGTRLDEDNEKHRTVFVYENLHRPPDWTALCGLFVIFLTLSMTLTSYLRKFGQSRLRLLRSQVGVFSSLALVMLGAKMLLLFTTFSEFWIPVAVIPLWVSTGYDRRTAFLIAVVLAFLVASLMRFDLLLLTTMLAQGMSATLTYLDRKNSRQMMLSGLLSGLSAAAMLVAMSATFEGRFNVNADLALFPASRIVACVGGGVTAGLLGILLRAPVLRILGHVARERLLDLTDLEHPLLQKMAREAPGSWEHSRAMANLAEAASAAIGADALLTRVGAYYHDLGKTAQAKYFVENLSHNERSPHEDLEPEVSADAIMAHVVVGTKILREGGVPEPVVEFAYTHHGTQIVEYFYNKCIEQGNPKGLTEDDFRYPGMKPQTKETAILMLVDSIEAASRTVDPPERQAFETMIQRIIFTKLKTGQLDESGVTLEDLRVLINRMTETLVNMHHHRIKYQWQAKQAEEFGVPSQTFEHTSRQSAPLPPLEWKEPEDVQPENKETPPPASAAQLTRSSVNDAGFDAASDAEDEPRLSSRPPAR